MTTKIPSAYVIVFALVVLAAVLTWILPGGSYKREKRLVGSVQRQVLVEGSYEEVPNKPQGFEVFSAPLSGFVRLAEIIAFIFMVGGAFFILNETGAIAAGIAWLVHRLEGRELLIIPIVMTFFSAFGAAFGMCEEAIPFVMIFVPLALALGYDSIVGISLSFVAAGVGFAAAFLNPFTLQIAQGIAGLEPVSGWGYRLILWAAATAMTIVWVMLYARRIQKHPEKSPMYELDRARREEALSARSKDVPFTWRHGACLGVLGASVAGTVVGVVVFEWFILELGGLFLAMGLLAGALSGMGPNAIAKAFVDGAKDMCGAAIIVGFAGGIITVLENGQILDTVLHALASLTSGMPRLLAADAMYVAQMCLNFFIPSGSTKAALTMPIFAPLADLSGITRQTAVLAYQLGDGFTNLIIPTSGVTMATLGMAKIPFEKWFRFHLPMQIAFFFFSLLALVYPVVVGWE
ncbi:MAG: AbgT family transporter [Myxococcota bacterium]|nr:AbgT family transporter [Myxococcota bacterium]